MKKLHSELKAKGVRVEEAVRPAWGAQGYGEQFKIWDPEGNKIELRATTRRVNPDALNRAFTAIGG